MSLERYSRQMRVRQIGEAGQQRLRAGRVLVCGCGALGSALADALVRAGVGFVRIVDRDFVELSNLQRQVLFDEDDVAQQLPKVIAAANKLRRINSSVTVEPIVADISPGNILSFMNDVDLVLDGMDNFETRFLINDACHEQRRPWVYAGCIGTHGQTMTIIPGETACLRCLIEDVPPAGSVETCDTAGVFAPIISVMTALQVVDAVKLLTGQREQIEPVLTIVDVWDGMLRRMNAASMRERGNCPACHAGERPWLRGAKGGQAVVLCGRNAVQISPAEPQSLKLADMATRWQTAGAVFTNPFLVRLTLAETGQQITLFPDGRAVVKGTDDPAVARGLYAKYVGT